MHLSKSKSHRHSSWPVFRLLLLVSALGLTLVPVYWMINTSLKTQVEVFASPPTLYPQKAVLENYVSLFTRRNLGAYLLNSVIIVTGSVSLAMAMGSLAAYALARFHLGHLQERISFWVLATGRVSAPVAAVSGLIAAVLTAVLVFTPAEAGTAGGPGIAGTVIGSSIEPRSAARNIAIPPPTSCSRRRWK